MNPPNSKSVLTRAVPITLLAIDCESISRSLLALPSKHSQSFFSCVCKRYILEVTHEPDSPARGLFSSGRTVTTFLMTLFGMNAVVLIGIEIHATIIQDCEPSLYLYNRWSWWCDSFCHAVRERTDTLHWKWTTSYWEQPINVKYFSQEGSPLRTSVQSRGDHLRWHTHGARYLQIQDNMERDYWPSGLKADKSFNSRSSIIFPCVCFHVSFLNNWLKYRKCPSQQHCADHF